MPQAEQFLQDRIMERFKNDLNDYEPMMFLLNAGYTLTKTWLWKPKPGVTNYAEMTADEYECLLFLVQEWDYGGLVTDADNDHNS